MKNPLFTFIILLFLLNVGVLYVFNRATKDHPSNYLYNEKRALSAISSFFNVFVLYHHFTHAPHPKFLMLRQRRFVMYTHIISGAIEFVTCWVAYLTGSEKFATIAALTAILAHVPSAYYQTSIVFGSRALMLTSYLFTISLHLFCAVKLYYVPSSMYWLLNMFLIHNVYVWCRVYYFFFNYVGVFKESIYTNSILTSGLTLGPAIFGVGGNMLFLVYAAASILLHFAIVRPNKEETKRFVCERPRDLLVNKAVHQAWINEKIRLAKLSNDDELTDKQQAKLAFDQLDTNKNGSLDGKEIDCLIKEWAVEESLIKKFSTWSKNGGISFEIFYNNVWRLGETSLGHRKKGDEQRATARARFIFDTLDYDQSGFIELPKLQKLLIQWGLPDHEVDGYLVYDYDDDKRFSFQEFFQNLKPVWEFAFQNMAVSNGDGIETQTKYNHTG